jgi:hypothetical protein
MLYLVLAQMDLQSRWSHGHQGIVCLVHPLLTFPSLVNSGGERLWQGH